MLLTTAIAPDVQMSTWNTFNQCKFIFCSLILLAKWEGCSASVLIPVIFTNICPAWFWLWNSWPHTVHWKWKHSSPKYLFGHCKIYWRTTVPEGNQSINSTRRQMIALFIKKIKKAFKQQNNHPPPSQTQCQYCTAENAHFLLFRQKNNPLV